MSAANKTRPPGVRNAGGVLDRIVDAKLARLSSARNANPVTELEAEARRLKQSPGRFLQALQHPDRANIIAEIKRRSPARGIIRDDFDPHTIACGYERAGAAAISILTEEDFFDGSLRHLGEARRHVDLPLLRKDFIFDSYQVAETAAAGASALLLIVAVLEEALLADLLAQSTQLGLDALIEVHDADEMQIANRVGARIIGINNRDLRTFEVGLDTSFRLARLAAEEDSVLVAESGIRSAADICSLKEAGFRGFLIGEHFMKAQDPAAELSQLLEAARRNAG